MRIVAIAALVGLVLSAAAPARAEPCGPHVIVVFHESSPDFVDIQNRSSQGWSLVALTIDLAGSLGRLIFDTDAAGEGVSMYQPFAGGRGEVRLEQLSGPRDGGEKVTLEFSGFHSGRNFSFSIDLDDRLTNSMYGQTHVDGSELAGARITVRLRAPTGSLVINGATFGTDNHATVGGGGCV